MRVFLTLQFLENTSILRCLDAAIDKKPKFQHRTTFGNGVITPFVSKHKNHMDAGVLLRQLCVVDVDNEKLVKHLEEIFPILNHVPTEITRAADTIGSSDLHSPKRKNTTTDQNTTHPRSGLQERSPQQEHQLRGHRSKTHSCTSQRDPEIRGDIVQGKMKAAEEASNKKTTFVTLQFHNGETLKIPSNSKVLRLFSYFEPLLDDQLDIPDHIPDSSPDHIPDSESEPESEPKSEPESETIPVPAPCTRTSFIDIYNAVSKTANTHSRSDIMFMFNRFILNDDDKFIMNDSVSVDGCIMDNCFRCLCVEADMLGLRQYRLQRLLEAVNASLDILRQNPNMWDAMALEWKCRTSDNATTRNACLVNLDDVSPIRRTCPPECTSSRNINWLFGGIDSKLGRVQARWRPSSISEPLVMDESLTVAEMSKQLHKSLPPEVLALLRLGAGKLVLAGGAALGMSSLEWRRRIGTTTSSLWA
eukprot:gene5418-5635_t